MILGVGAQTLDDYVGAEAVHGHGSAAIGRNPGIEILQRLKRGHQNREHIGEGAAGIGFAYSEEFKVAQAVAWEVHQAQPLGLKIIGEPCGGQLSLIQAYKLLTV